MIRAFPWILFSAVALASCAKLGEEKVEEPNPFGPTGIPPELRAKSSGGATATVAPAPLPPLNVTPDDDMIFTNPDDPDAGLPELSTVLSQPKRGPWEESETIARQRSAREGKALLIWFTDSESSPMCKALSQELFSTPEFEKWADEKIIRLRIDSYTRVKDPNLDITSTMDREASLRGYVKNLEKRYKILGHPSVIMLNPSGEVIARYRGFQRGDASHFWGLIKHSESVSANAYQSWRAGLEKKGYREWQDRRGRKVFAKLASYSKSGVVLIEPDGTRARTSESKLSDGDQEWLAQQKKLRGIQ